MGCQGWRFMLKNYTFLIQFIILLGRIDPSIESWRGILTLDHKLNGEQELFDDWPEKYDQWFETPIGALVKQYEGEVLWEFLRPSRGERILDVGCGTGIFTLDFLSTGVKIVGVDISIPMIRHAQRKPRGHLLQLLGGDILALPFANESFDKSISVTALEFIADARRGVQELFRVTRRGGTIVVATLNSLSPWATRRKAKQHPIFDQAIFRSPAELKALAPQPGLVRTAVHFQKDEDTAKAPAIEINGRKRNSLTGAFVAVKWEKL